MTKAGIRRRCRLTVILALTGWLVFAGCRHDSYDSGTGEYSLVRGDFVEAVVDGYADVRSFVTDDGDSLVLTVPFAARWVTRQDTVYRAMTYYRIVDKGRAEVVSMGEVPVLVPADADKMENIATDPLTFESMWMSRSGRYLNVAFWLKTGSVNDDDTHQTVGIVNQGIHENTDGTRVLHLCIIHNQGGVPEYYSRKHYVSVPRSSLSGADSVRITVPTYQGVVVKTVRL